jgi:hypothetical protein
MTKAWMRAFVEDAADTLILALFFAAAMVAVAFDEIVSWIGEDETPPPTFETAHERLRD